MFFELDPSVEYHDTFRGWCPMLIKGMGLGQSPNGGDQVEMAIGGVISTNGADFQGEELNQDGVDWQYFADHGLINYNHTPLIVGEPTKVVRQGPKTLMEGRLYSEVPEANRIYKQALLLKRSGARRGYRFSVEGGVLQRKCGCKTSDPKNCKAPEDHGKILKARVMNVSVCEHAQNGDTNMDVLHKAAEIGYQQAAIIDPAYSLSALVPQSLDGAAAVATYRAAVRCSWPCATNAECDAIVSALIRRT